MPPDGLPDPEKHPHGTRGRYVSTKCRCAPCKAANTAYYHATKDRGVLVDATPARLHLAQLSSQGLGTRRVAAALGMNRKFAINIANGTKTQIRAAYEKKILALTISDADDGTAVPAAPTWKRLRQLLEWGYTKTELAERLGYQTRAIQMGKRKVLARTERAVAELYEVLLDERKRDRELADVCLDCGLSHAKAARQRVLNRLLPITHHELAEFHPCLWPLTNTGLQLYIRDCIDLGKWHYPRAAIRPQRLAREAAAKLQRQAA